jgi:Antibiotic biosynthesis monooxygenase
MPDTTGTTDVTFVNVFTCAEQRQYELVAALDKATAEVLAHLPGFLSATIHASRDKTRVLNYARWATVEDFDAMQGNPDVRDQMVQIIAIAESADPRLYDVRAAYDR